jgi:hypothetical protein
MSSKRFAIEMPYPVRNEQGVKKMTLKKNLLCLSLGLAFATCFGVSQAQTAPAGLMDKMQKNGCSGCPCL